MKHNTGHFLASLIAVSLLLDEHQTVLVTQDTNRKVVNPNAVRCMSHPVLLP